VRRDRLTFLFHTFDDRLQLPPSRGRISLFLKRSQRSLRPRLVTRVIEVVAVVLSVMTLSFTFAPSASAYALEGYKWGVPEGPGTCCATINVYFEAMGYITDYHGWVDGFNAWNASPALMYLGDNYDPNDGLHVADVDDVSVPWDGLTQWRVTSDGYFTQVRAYLNYYFTQDYDAGTIQGVATHEFGHSVGLAHSPGCVVMTPYTQTRFNCNVTTPTADDVNGINAIY